LVRLQVTLLVPSNAEGNVIFQEASLPKVGRPGPKALIERDWNTDVRIDIAEMEVL
jgi:hypothetical protein